MFLHGELPQLARLSADISEAGLEIIDVESWRLYLASGALGFQRGWSNLHQVLASRAHAAGSHELPWSRADLYPQPGVQECSRLARST